MAKQSFNFNEATEQIKQDRNLALIVGGFAATLLGLFFPWYEIGIFGNVIKYSPGLGDFGLVVAAACIVGGGAALNVLDKDAKQMKNVVLGSAIVAAFFVLTNYPDSDLDSFNGVGIGYWLSAVGVVATVVGVLRKR